MEFVSEEKRTRTLALIENLAPLEIFEWLDPKSEKPMHPAIMYHPGVLDAIVSRIEEHARKLAEPLDISTEANRKALASVAYKVARSKSYIDDAGKALGDGLRSQLSVINDDRKMARDRLDAAKETIRKPLTDWENADKERIAKHEAALLEIQNAGILAVDNRQGIVELEETIKLIEAYTRNWEEFAQRAAGVKAVALAQLRKSLEAARRAEAERAAAKRLEEEERERQIKAREEIAARKAKEDAERIAKEEAVAAELRAKSIERRAEAERERLENEKREAEENAKLIAENARRALEAAEQRRKDQEAQAKLDRIAAVEAERKRVAGEAAAEKAAAEKREQNKRHRAKINREAADAVQSRLLCTGEVAKTFVDDVVKGLIPHMTVNY